jgi:hypothetical protein
MLRAAVCACLLGAALVTPAAAGKPTMEVIKIADVGILDEFLTEACGFDVFFDGAGHFTLRQFTDRAGDFRGEVNNFAIRVRYYSEFGSVNAVDTGADRVTVLDDGSRVFSIIGNVQSITVPGHGRVYSETGKITFHVTFDAEGNEVFELISAAGQHPEEGQEVALCEFLGP